MTRQNSTRSVAVETLNNTGLHVLNAEAAVPAQRTLIVLGLARSGTTMIAGALHHLGVDMMGGAPPNPVFEDTALGAAIEHHDTAELLRLIARRDAAQAVWGWKRPSAIEHIGRIERHFRHPEYVVVFRDLFAIANRNRISVQADVLDNMRKSLAQSGQLLDFLSRTRRRALMVSYEKAMLDKVAFVQALADFAGTGTEGAGRARRYIQRDSQAYLAASRTWGGRGRLGRASPQLVTGWASWHGDDSPVDVQISVNGRERAIVHADQLRPQLLRNGAHSTGRCGFEYRPPQGSLVRGDIVTARIVGDVVDLPGSPQVLVVAPRARRSLK